MGDIGNRRNRITRWNRLKGCWKLEKSGQEEVSYVLHSVEGTLSPVTQTGLKKGKSLSLRNGAIFCTLGPKTDGSEAESNVNEVVNNTCIKSADVTAINATGV